MFVWEGEQILRPCPLALAGLVLCNHRQKNCGREAFFCVREKPVASVLVLASFALSFRGCSLKINTGELPHAAAAVVCTLYIYNTALHGELYFARTPELYEEDTNCSVIGFAIYSANRKNKGGAGAR